MQSVPASPAWQFFIDRGGTFTDVVAQSPAGARLVRKVLSQSPGQREDAAVAAVRAILAEHGAPLDAIGAVKMGTTVATNALLERKGAPTLLVITEGFADALAIGWQSRPDIFARHIRKPAPLYAGVMEARERMTAEGVVRTPLDEARATADFAAARAAGFDAVAIVCLHGWAYPEHERRLGALAAAAGFGQITLSHEAARLIKLTPRGETAVADAYLSPGLRAYVAAVADALAVGDRLSFMQSNGGLAPARTFRGRDSVLSGPAGGVVAMAAAAEAAGFDRALGFDMGGTSTDVSHFAGAFERAEETQVAGVRLAAPMLQVHTIAAGGGSICRFDGARLRVGPQSAGADPGPACYRRGGPVTITDCNVLLGRIQPSQFPALFGPEGDAPLDAAAVERAFAALAREIAAAGARLDPRAIAEGFLAIAVDQMAEAIRKISLQRGYDPRAYVLVAFGGAGGQHACAVADAVGVETVLIHPLAGVLSAWGMGLARPRVVREATVNAPLTDELDLAGAVGALEAEALAAFRADHPGIDAPQATAVAHLAYAGADSAIALALAPAGRLAEDFHTAHGRRFGFAAPDAAVMVTRLTVDVTPPGGAAGRRDMPAAPAMAPPATRRIIMRSAGADHETPMFERESLPPGARITGPALIVEAASTTVVEPGWQADVRANGDLVLQRRQARAPASALGPASGMAEAPAAGDAAVDPIRLEMFANRFMAIAEEMGLALQASARSVNIKERLDFSCAVFDAAGGLVANAPHIPVHLGSMGDSVRAVKAAYGARLKPGDAVMLNAPYKGGTHLPDITVITPVFLDDRPEPSFFVAARGHHGDVGGISPGSMPPMSRHVDEEGVLIDCVVLAQRGVLDEPAIRALFTAGPHPARNPDQNIADLKAQLAACTRGGEELRRLAAVYGEDAVVAYMGHVQANAEAHIRAAIDRLSDGSFSCTLDGGETVDVRVQVDHVARAAVIDFTHSSDQSPANFNAPASIARAASLYVFRTLVDEAIPLNEGCLRPLIIRTRPGSLLEPVYPAAVVAGNVETSQVACDALYGALGVLAGSQGTMNNFTFGDAARQYYETICGGAGAGPDFDGADAVQTHMTNSRLTDPEVLETRFPVFVERFAIRRGSGGLGRRRGGDGVVRAIRFRAPMSAGILSNRRTQGAFGLCGGEPGAPGRNWIERADGRREDLAATAAVSVAAGDLFVIETPGGGGYGPA